MKHVILLLILIPVWGYSQSHIKNQYFLQFNFGAYDKFYPTKDNYFLQLEHGKYSKRLNGRGVGFLYAHKLSSNGVPIEKFQASYKHELTMFSSANLVHTFKMLGTINFGYETINRDKEIFQGDVINNKSAFILALGTGAEYEFTPIVIGIRSTYNFLSQYQKFTTYPYLGVKIHFQ